MLDGKELLNFDSKFIYESINWQNELPVKVIKVEMKKDNPDLIPPKHWHNCIEFIIPLNAKIKIWSDGETYVVNENEIGLINSKSIHTSDVIESRDIFKSIVIQIDLDYLSTLYSNFKNIYFNSNLTAVSQSKLSEYLLGITEAFDSSYTSMNIAIKGYIHLVVSTLINNQTMNREDNSYPICDNKRNNLTELLKYIDINYDQEIDIQMLADKFNFSYGHLSRLFKRQFGTTIKQYIMSIRLDRSMHDLVHTSMTITQISIKHGFYNTKSFRKEFKSKYDVTPYNYRKKFENDLL